MSRILNMNPLLGRNSAAIFYFFGLLICRGLASTWSEWWTYGGISGSEFWGLVNPDWFLCTKGLHQSPINILPSKLIFDPHLSPIQFDRLRTGVTLANTGHDLKLTLDDLVTSYVNVTGGPLAYQYRITELNIHFGEADNRGSQHLVDGKALPGELQIIGFNSDLYHNMSDAVKSSRGLCGIAVFLQIADKGNDELEILKNHLPEVVYKGKSSKIKSFMLADILPPTEHYVTYDGSLNQPACDETVTWVVYNKPVYVSGEFMLLLRKLMQGDEQNLKAPLSDNFRRIQMLNNRPIRTNINFSNSTPECTVVRQTTYGTNFHSTSFQ